MRSSLAKAAVALAVSNLLSRERGEPRGGGPAQTCEFATNQASSPPGTPRPSNKVSPHQIFVKEHTTQHFALSVHDFRTQLAHSSLSARSLELECSPAILSAPIQPASHGHCCVQPALALAGVGVRALRSLHHRRVALLHRVRQQCLGVVVRLDGWRGDREDMRVDARREDLQAHTSPGALTAIHCLSPSFSC